MKKTIDQMTREEQEELLKQISLDLKNSLSKERYLHSISTMNKAKELANMYNIDEMIAMLTGLTHDIAKEMSKEEYIEYANKNSIEIDEFDRMQDTMLHGKIGADIVKNKYGFTKEMQDAIFYHTTGRANMTDLDKIIFLADKVEDTRKGGEFDILRNIIKKDGLEKAILWNIETHTIPWLIKNKKLIHPNCIYARNDIINKLEKESD